MRSLLALALVAATPVAASAGTYLGLGVGTNASGHISNDANSMTTDGNHSGRALIGIGFGHLAIEGSGTRYTMPFAGRSTDDTSLAAQLKYSLPLGNNFEAFGRGGLQRTYLSAPGLMNGGTSGNGWVLGGGFEYRLNLVATAASIFVDYTHSQTSFDWGAGRQPLDATATMWTLGLTVSI